MGLPREQVNERGALTLLALANLNENSPWSDASRPQLRIHDILVFAKGAYGKEYAENTRETIRRQTIHQFEQAGLVVKNEDKPHLATNSPHTRYALSSSALELIRRFKTDRWHGAVETFTAEKPKLMELYDRRRRANEIEFILPDGEKINLSAGGHNQLQKDVVEKFRPAFAPKASLLYVGDTANKMAHINEKELESLGVPIDKHNKLPDVILYDAERGVLLLIEAVTTHGPVTPKRRMEIEELLANCKARRIYISAFPSDKEFRAFFSEIAWETEIWIAEEPRHMIHKNGEKFCSIY